MAERWTGWKKSLMNNTAGDLALLNLKTASSSIRGAASLVLAMLIFTVSACGQRTDPQSAVPTSPPAEGKVNAGTTVVEPFRISSAPLK